MHSATKNLKRRDTYRRMYGDPYFKRVRKYLCYFGYFRAATWWVVAVQMTFSQELQMQKSEICVGAFYSYDNLVFWNDHWVTSPALMLCAKQISLDCAHWLSILILPLPTNSLKQTSLFTLVKFFSWFKLSNRRITVLY